MALCRIVICRTHIRGWDPVRRSIARLRPGAVWYKMQLQRLAYLLYCRDERLRAELKRLLAGVSVERARSRNALRAPPTRTCATVYAIAECSDADVGWLRSAFGPLSPACVVVAPLGVGCLRRLQALRSRSLRIVWLDEAEDRLLDVLEEVARDGRDPMWHLGLRLLSDYPVRPSVQKTISRVCGLDNDPGGTPFVPENSVGQLAADAGLGAPTLSRYWREDVPLACSLKEFLSWALLLWAVRERSRDSWNSIAAKVGIRRRTLQRSSTRLAGCTLAEAGADPERALRRFNQWIESRRGPGFSDAPGTYDLVPAEAAQLR